MSHISRRHVLVGTGMTAATAAIIGLPGGAQAIPRPHAAGSSGQVWRGAGQNMRQTVQGFAGGAIWSQCTRSRHYCNHAFRYARFVIATFYNAPTGGYTDTTGPIAAVLPLNGSAIIADIDLPYSLTFQLALEYPFTNVLTGIPARQQITFGGSATVYYVPGSTNTGFILSDIVDFGSIVPSGTFFGLWTTQEATAGYGSTNYLPYQATASNNYTTGFNRYQGVTTINTNTTGLISSNFAAASSSIGALTTSQSGSSSWFTPCMMLTLRDSTIPSIMGIGDSICYGVGEGGNGSGNYGDGLGSALGNAGYCARWVYEVLNHDFVNFGRGSDGYQYFSDIVATAAYPTLLLGPTGQSTWQYRLPLAALVNPTHILSENVHNTISPGYSYTTIKSCTEYAYATFRRILPGVPIIQAACTPDAGCIQPTWTKSQNYAVGGICYNFNGSTLAIYTCTSAGTSASSGTGPAGSGTGITDGTAVWSYTSNVSPQINLWGQSVAVTAGQYFIVPSGSTYNCFVYLTGGTTASTGTGPSNTTVGATVTDGSATCTCANLSLGSLQRPSVGWVASTYSSNTSASNRGKFNDLVVKTYQAMGNYYNYGYIDPNPVVEYNYTEGNSSTETSLWKGSGTAYYFTGDGTHPNSLGHASIASGIVCYVWERGILTAVSDPFTIGSF